MVETKKFLQTGRISEFLSLGVLYDDVKKNLSDFFTNQDIDNVKIITDNNGVELTFIQGKLISCNYPLSDELCDKTFVEVLNYLDEFNIKWGFDRNMTFERQLSVSLKYSKVCLLFTFEVVKSGKLDKIILSDYGMLSK